MSMGTGTSSVPAGWYPDPEGSAAARWWSGEGWTAHLQQLEAPTAVAEPVVEPPVETAIAAYVPFAHEPKFSRPISPRFLPWSTIPGWWLATMPIWSTALAVGAAVAIGTNMPGWVDLLARLALLFIAAALTMADRKQLLEAGHRHAASVWWFLLGPLVYLIARAIVLRRVTGHGWAPVVVWLAAILAPAAIIGLLVLGML